MMKNKLILYILCIILLIIPVLGAKTYTWDPTWRMIRIAGATSGDRMDFDDITDYFRDNPIETLPFRMPRVNGNWSTYELTENNSAEWVLNGSSGNISSLNWSSNKQTNNVSLNITRNGTGGFGISWNSDFIYDDPDMSGWNTFDGSIAKTIKFWIKVSNSSINLNTFSARGSTSASVPERNGIRTKNTWSKNFSANTWKEITIDIRNDTAVDEDAIDTSTMYFSHISKISFNFTGGGNEDTVLIDGLRFEREDINPVEIYENVYMFPTPFRLSTWFADTNYTVIMDSLMQNKEGYDFYTYASAVNMSFGDAGEQRYGGTIYFNSYYDVRLGLRSLNLRTYNNGYLYFSNYVQGKVSNDMNINLVASSNSLVSLRFSQFFHGVDFQPRTLTGGKVTIEDTEWHGGRRGFRGCAGDDITVKNYAIFATTSDIKWTRASNTTCTTEGISIYQPNSVRILASDDYAYVGNATLREINMDLTNVAKGVGHVNIDSHYTAHTITQFLASTFFPIVIDNEGTPINNVNITIKDNTGEVVNFNITNSSGMVEKQIIDFKQWNATQENKNFNLFYGYGSFAEPILKYPFTFIFEHSNYPKKEFKYNMTYPLGTPEEPYAVNLENNYPWEINGTIKLEPDATLKIVHCS